MSTVITPTSAASSAASGVNSIAKSAQDTSQQFLTLLVTQLKNQDPLNPVDNAQMTSQMAQISTVSGIEKLNTTVTGLNGQFIQMQALQGAALIGRDVTLPGNQFSVANGAAQGSFSIDAAATQVKVDVMNSAGVAVDTLNLGAQASGLHSFTWPNGASISQSDGYTFKVTASSGNTAVTSTTLMHDTVSAVNAGGATLTLQLARNGNVPYSAVTTVN